MLHERTGPVGGRDVRVTTARHVVLAAGTWGTQQLLHAMKARASCLGSPRRLGAFTRTNSEALLGAMTQPCPTDARPHPGRRDHVVVPPRRRHPRGELPLRQGVERHGPARRRSRCRGTTGRPRLERARRKVGPATPGGPAGHAGSTPPVERADRRRPRHAEPRQLLRTSPAPEPVRRGPGSRPARATATPTRPTSRGATPRWRRLAARLEEATGDYAAGRRLVGRGVRHADDGALHRWRHHRLDARAGVVDAYHRVWGHPGISVVDGAAVSANLGVNPSLTITAQAERAMSLWPNRGRRTPGRRRPAMLVGRGYAVLAPVPPRHRGRAGFLMSGAAAEGPGRGGAGAGRSGGPHPGCRWPGRPWGP